MMGESHGKSTLSLTPVNPPAHDYQIRMEGVVGKNEGKMDRVIAEGQTVGLDSQHEPKSPITIIIKREAQNRRRV